MQDSFIMNEPLKWSKERSRKGFFDDFPFIGYDAQERRRFQKILSDRDVNGVVFDGNGEQQKMHVIVAPVIKEYFKWENSLFLVGDKVSPLVYEYDGSMGFIYIELMLLLEKKLKVQFGEEVADIVFSKSYGDFLNYLISVATIELNELNPAVDRSDLPTLTSI